MDDEPLSNWAERHDAKTARASSVASLTYPDGSIRVGEGRKAATRAVTA
ncbi:hypothetical protein ACIHCQ_27830 [Streptomyces sp. NPDC052236]